MPLFLSYRCRQKGGCPDSLRRIVYHGIENIKRKNYLLRLQQTKAKTKNRGQKGTNMNL